MALSLLPVLVNVCHLFPVFMLILVRVIKEQKSAVNPAVLTPSSILIFDPWQCLLSLQYPGKIASNCINSARWPEGKCLTWSSWKHPRVLYSLIIVVVGQQVGGSAFSQPAKIFIMDAFHISGQISMNSLIFFYKFSGSLLILSWAPSSYWGRKGNYSAYIFGCVWVRVSWYS